MPNFCSCSITVEGDKIQMKEFYKTLLKPNGYGEESVFSFYQIVPHENKNQTDMWVELQRS